MIFQETRVSLSRPHLFTVLNDIDCHVHRNGTDLIVFVPGLDRHLIPYFGVQPVMQLFWDEIRITQASPEVSGATSEYLLKWNYWTPARTVIHIVFSTMIAVEYWKNAIQSPFAMFAWFLSLNAALVLANYMSVSGLRKQLMKATKLT